MIRINLAPPEARRRRPSFSLPIPSFNLGVVFVVVYLLTGGGVGYYWMGLLTDETNIAREVEQYNRELLAMKKALGDGANVKPQLAEVKRKVAVLEEITKGQGRSIALLDAFIDTVPRDLWIVAMEQKDATVKLSGVAFSTTAVSDFLTNLKTSGRFKDVDITISRQAIDKTPSTVTFEVTCKFEI